MKGMLFYSTTTATTTKLAKAREFQKANYFASTQLNQRVSDKYYSYDYYVVV